MTAHPPAIHALLDGKADAAKVDAFLKGKTFPHVEGSTVTWVFRGEADGVTLRHWIYGLETGTALTRIPNTDLWYLVLDGIPPCSRVEYKLELHLG